ncbi:ABC transporter substrate-binding protein [Neobacillus rhizophilus]|uniref:ABC transporter substrate-binding protein n=1 Tax=Neobacillus rhizophilus TaxID=2833579 RepID=A0A942U590_9BACI|nr:ABC transporter substrate-binding protein [Neobacillus rhizophilus]MBS4214956.1 ABC transporter substrate-binding protein [Neobacillus rhizophilus]
MKRQKGNFIISKKLILILVLFTFSFLMAACGGGKNEASTQNTDKTGKSTVPGVTDKKILIGANAPLSGPLAASGAAVYPAIEAYFKKINDEGGIHGRNLEFVYYDDEYNPSKTVGVVKRLVEEDKVFMVNMLGAGPTAAVADYLKEKNVPVVPAITGVTNLLKYKNIFEMYPDYKTDGHTLAKYAIKELEGKKIAVWYQNDDYGKNELEAITDELEKSNMTLVKAIPYNPTDVDFSSSVLQLKEAKPDVLIMAPAQKPLAQFLKDAKKLDLKTKFLVSYAAADISIANLAGPAAEGVIFSSYQKPFVADSSDPKMKELQKFSKEYLNGKEPTFYEYIGILVAQLTVEALNRAGEDPTSEKVISEMEKMENWNGSWIVDNVTYGPNQHGLGSSSMYFMKIQDGKFVKMP